MGANEFKQTVEKRWDEERNRISTPSQTWLIPHPKSSSWGDLKDYNKVSLVKNIIGYTPRINTKGDERNMRIYLKRSSKSDPTKIESNDCKINTNRIYLKVAFNLHPAQLSGKVGEIWKKNNPNLVSRLRSILF